MVRFRKNKPARYASKMIAGEYWVRNLRGDIGYEGVQPHGLSEIQLTITKRRGHYLDSEEGPLVQIHSSKLAEIWRMP